MKNHSNLSLQITIAVITSSASQAMTSVSRYRSWAQTGRARTWPSPDRMPPPSFFGSGKNCVLPMIMFPRPSKACWWGARPSGEASGPNVSRPPARFLLQRVQVMPSLTFLVDLIHDSGQDDKRLLSFLSFRPPCAEGNFIKGLLAPFVSRDLVLDIFVVRSSRVPIGDTGYHFPIYCSTHNNLVLFFL